jgi:hypothetical protein
MQRTPRHWRWAAAGVALIAAAHLAVSVPAVRARGWIGAAPSSALVLIDLAAPGVGHGTAMSELRRRAAGQTPSLVDGWVTRRGVFLVGRWSSDGAVTDQGGSFGRLMLTIVNGALEGGRAYRFEQEWAEGVLWVGLEPRARVPPGAPVWAEVRVLRLIRADYRVVVGDPDDGVWFDAHVWDRGVMGPNPGPGMTPGQQRASERGDRVLGMGPALFGVHQERGMNAVVVRLGDAGREEGVAEVSVSFRVMTPQGAGWAEQTAQTVAVRYRVDAGATPERVEPGPEADALRRAIAGAMSVNAYPFTRRTDGTHGIALMITMRDVPDVTRSVTIGGAMEIGYWREAAGGLAWQGLGSVGPGWYRVMPVPAGESAEDWSWRAEQLLVAWPQESTPEVEWFAGAGSAADAGVAGTEPVMLRIGVGNRDEAWADLDAERVLDDALEIETGMTTGEVARFLATGKLKE